ncbi:MAG: hypothetical protein Ct9H300mP28_25000 [Pseudomonadota bacterium]|nr:MAG: hypothetical protein Ct9H300mP28_25000 [Pseudomonadota bacterium]
MLLHLFLKNFKDESGRLLRRWCDGEARFQAYLCDYAQMVMACLDLYETTYDRIGSGKDVNYQMK